MERSKYNDHFTKFPYRKEVRDDDINNGGIDLVKEPHRISEIHELNGALWLKNFIINTNSNDKLFMSFGCVQGSGDNNSILGYVDLSLRPESPVEYRSDIKIMDELFIQYLRDSMISQGMENPQQAIEYAQSVLVWEWTPLEIYGKTYEKFCVTFQASEIEGIVWVFDHLDCFLNQYYPSIKSSV
ncbi:hypothetical protein PXH59_03785 [Xenorhabdus sp. SF857]|uniref:hypothetical protein n=1 Tax=Xenorhabdus bakwenae TaxID=3026967 RepID=UPI002557E374|nr:hypothetical protein [Xenorhabdus sp. SF857]WFQ80295.1 hypothetical protein PXH59_03785 [Xenorhabdus sp. SF857]